MLSSDLGAYWSVAAPRVRRAPVRFVPTFSRFTCMFHSSLCPYIANNFFVRPLWRSLISSIGVIHPLYFYYFFTAMSGLFGLGDGGTYPYLICAGLHCNCWFTHITCFFSIPFYLDLHYILRAGDGDVLRAAGSSSLSLAS